MFRFSGCYTLTGFVKWKFEKSSFPYRFLTSSEYRSKWLKLGGGGESVEWHPFIFYNSHFPSLHYIVLYDCLSDAWELHKLWKGGRHPSSTYFEPLRPLSIWLDSIAAAYCWKRKLASSFWGYLWTICYVHTDVLSNVRRHFKFINLPF